MTQDRAESGDPPPTTSATLARAIALHRSGKLRDAEPLYAAVLAAEPDHPDALHFLGVLRHAQGASDEAASLIHRSLERAPDNFSAWNNLGNVLLEAGQTAVAAAAYGAVVKVWPDAADAYHNLGVALQTLGRVAEAETALQRAIALDPGRALFHYSLALSWLRRSEPATALPILARALELAPDFAQAQILRIRAIRLAAKQPGAALDALADWLRHEPDNPIARHLYAAYSGAPPARAADDYIHAIFDNYAAAFDEHLGRLGYRAPQLLQEAVARVLGPPQGTLDVLDAGCGTGLCGPLFRPFARRLDGVDLSEAMLAKARRRDAYDELTAGELTAFVAARKEAWDLIVSADTLVYFGDLAPVASAASGALRRGGVLAFSLERRDAAEPERGYRVEEHGRYSHTADYVRRVLEEAGLAILVLDHAVPRNEGGAPVAGLVVVARKVGDGAHSKA